MDKEKRKAGRKKLQEKDKKKVVTFRIHPNKKEELDEKAQIFNGGNLSEYINQQLFFTSKNIHLKQNSVKRNELYTMIREVNRQGNNLNQLTRLAHEGKFIDEELKLELAKILLTNEKINDSLIEMLGNDR